MKKLLDFAAKMYYQGSPIMSDAAFDRLAETTGYETVGATVDEEAMPHYSQMYSLQKLYMEDGSYDTALPEPVVVTPKLDGAAISLLYVEGRLTMALTRGDGIHGRVITSNIERLSSIPKSITGTAAIVQITGEVVAPKDIPNARNYAAGALGLKSAEEFSERDLTFVAYDIYPNTKISWTAELMGLRSNGFHTVLDSNWDQFPHDGTVWRCDDYTKFKELGYTQHHPRGAFALKVRQPGVITKLLNVVWQIGKSGVVSPVAILEPVLIGEATVSRATLHNMKYIQDLGLEIGCMVEVIRSGEIIPRVVRRVN
jgi:DNA ligase (NAD+)